jgi:hypothetical protein
MTRNTKPMPSQVAIRPPAPTPSHKKIITSADIAISTATLERWAEAIRAATYWDHMSDDISKESDPVELEIRAIIAQRKEME